MGLRRLLPRSVGVRVALVVNLIVLVGGVGYLAFDYYRESRHRLEDRSLALREQAMTLHQAVSGLARQSAAEHQHFIDAVCARMSDEEAPGHHIVVEIDGKALQSRAHHRDSDEFLRAVRTAGERDAGGGDGDLIVGKHAEGGITVYVAERLGRVRAEIRAQTLLRSAGLVAFGLVLAVAITLAIHRLVHRPLRRLVRTIDGIAAGNFATGPAAERLDGTEIGRLAGAIQAMSLSLGQAQARRNAALDRARRVQGNLLPGTAPIAGLDFAFFHRAAEDVAGDYFDLFQTPAGTTVLCVADVVGHGVAAAMIAAMLKVQLLEAAEVHDDPGELLGRLNRRFSAVNLPEDFATVFLAVWRPETRTLAYAGAGHEPGLVLAGDAGPVLLRSTGPMIGLDPAITWQTQAITLAPGDLLACWTDGVVEATGPAREQFGRSRLVSLAERHRQAGAKRLVERIERALREHMREEQAADDCTFLAVRFA